MGTSDKTDKPNTDQVDQKDGAATPLDATVPDTVEDAQIIEAEDASEADNPLDLQEPDAPTESDENLDDSVEAPEAVLPDAADAPQEAPRKSAFVPMVLGGVIAAVIGFAGAVYFGEQLGLGGNAEAARATLKSEFEAQLATQAAEIEKLSRAQSGTAQALADSQAAVAEAATGFGALQTQATALASQVTTFETRLNDIEKRPLTEGLSAAAIAAYEREVKDLKELVSAQKAAASELKDKADLSAQTALARSSVSRMVAALDSGAPYRAAIVDLRSATGDVVSDVLDSHADDGVATLATLIESFPEHARAALAQARAENSAGDTGGKIGNFFKTHLGARSVQAREGNDADAVLSRAEAALKQGDLMVSLEELQGLADGPKEVMSTWVAQARIRLETTTAAEEMAQRLNSK